MRSVLAYATRRGVCVKCSGRDLATGKMVELGQAVGVIAAQSSEPDRTLTLDDAQDDPERCRPSTLLGAPLSFSKGRRVAA